MYKARAEIVSGTKVYADGKWLQCIGNKTVRAGDYIWTDGRCVYGYNNVPQQPPIVITQAEKIILIPIITTKGYYIFYKGALKLIELNEIFTFNNPHDYHPVFVNNKSAKAYFVNNYVLPQYVTVFHRYSGTDDNTELEEDFDVKCVIAANVDKSGNLLTLRINGFNIEVLENEKIVQQKNFKELVEQIKSETPTATAPSISIQYLIDTYGHPVPESTTSRETVDFIVNCAFIENKDNWAVYTTLLCNKDSNKFGLGDATSSSLSFKYVHYCIANDGTTPYTGDSRSYSWGCDDMSYVINIIIESNPEEKILLQDGYYFKEETIITPLSVDNFFSVHLKRTIYSPNDEKIFTGIFDRPSSIIFSKVKGGFLMAVNFDRDGYSGTGYRYSKDVENLQTKLGLPYFLNGIFLLREKKWKSLTDKFTNEYCLNQQFRPMKKITNWQKKIQEITLN